MAGLYIHIPFCRSKCFYCDFYSHPTDGEFADYVDALLNEWELRRRELTEPITTIYLGGGTPSLLPLRELDRLTATLSETIEIDRLEEFTIESNPEDISQERLNAWRRAGIGRVSIGVQSFDDEMLATIGRRHKASESVKALDTLASSGFNYNADLIYGLPGQTANDWNKELRRMIGWKPPHLSCYLLSYEPGTRLYAMMQKGKVAETEENLASEMYHQLCEETSAAGYEHYEISNFAMSGMKARHNSKYWNYTPYLGLGAGAHSFTNGVRSFNPWNTKAYVKALKEGELTTDREEDETTESRLNDYIITSLRTSEGFDREKGLEIGGEMLMKQFETNVAEVCKTAPMLIEQKNGRIRIPERKWLTADAILRELIL